MKRFASAVYWRLVRARKFKGSRISFWARLSRDLDIGNGSSIARGCILTTVNIGRFTYLSEQVVAQVASIGSFCSIGREVKIGGGTHPTTFVSTSPAFYSKTSPLPKSYATTQAVNELRHITIADDVWIGTAAIVLDGLKIGQGAIIGAGAVITKDVPPYAVVGGVPAKIIRFRFDEETITRLLRFPFSKLPHETLAEIAPLLQHPVAYLNWCSNHWDECIRIHA